ncbi:MAG TPA: carboxy terminal-processing peptidase [Thermoguttaceae bacterium]|nr:carboxy terminal-processing peptidase [Thermoguttaceae bacterium]
MSALVVFSVAWSLCAPAFADPQPPTAQDRRIAQIVTKLLERDHLTEHPLDDEISERCLTTFLKSLDPWKLYFYQSDVDRFMSRRHELDDLARSRRFDEFLGFAYQVFGTLMERIDQRAQMVEELVAMDHDFTVDEEIVRDPDLVRYPQNEDEARERWRKLIKYDLLTLKLEGIEGEEAVTKLRSRYQSRFRRAHQTDREELLEIYLTAMTTAFDPHTAYMSPDTLENFNIVMRLQLEGIGAALQSVDGETVVKEIIPGGAADKNGRLKVKDRIVGVGEGEQGEIEDVVNMKLKNVVKRIRGARGTIVRLEVVSDDSPERKTIQIKRDKIELKDSEARGKVFEEGRKPDGEPYKIGVIDLPSFYMDMSGASRGVPNYKSSTVDVEKIVRDFRAKGVDAIVLDLRQNGGGSLTEAVNLTGLFVEEEGVVVQVKGAGRQEVYSAPPRAKSLRELEDRYHSKFVLDPEGCWSGPLVVLTSKFSASASEILAGAIQDYRRGLIVGDRATHGKGTVQSLVDLGRQIFDLPNVRDEYGALKITQQRFYRPSGASTQNRGVLADVELPSLTTHLDVAEADLDYPVAFHQVRPLEFKKLDRVDETISDRLSYLSSQRRQESEDFQEVLQDIDRYLERKERKTVTLNEAKFMAEMEDLNADKEEKETIEQMSDPSDNGIERNYYLDEALAITADYLKLMNDMPAN